VNCPSCGLENRDDASFCGECGATLAQEIVCPNCRRSNPAGRKFCDGCGQRLAEGGPQVSERAPRSYTPKHLAERILAEQAALETRGGTEGERKTITALFADIKGSMELIEDLDPEEARRIVDPALQLMMDAVHRYEGYVAQSTGDGIFALFGAPIAHEDHPQRALYAALRMQEDAERYGDQLQIENGIRLPIRVGINTGEVVVRSIRKDDLHTDYLPVGHSTSLAARMESLAKPGTIVVSEHTHKLIEGYFQFKTLGPAKVKGVSEPVEVYEVMGVGPLRTRLQVAVQRGLVRFVGRQNEMDQMRRALDSAREGHGQIVAIVGEAGVGKSRLVYEFKLTSESSALVLETFSVSHGKAYAYLPLVDLLKNYFQIQLQDDERRRREKVTGKVLTLDRSLEDTLPYLFSLLGILEPTSPLNQMDSEIKRRRTFDVIKRLLLRESLNQPLLLIFEDLHWLDGETEAFLNVLSESLATANVLLVTNYRPQYRHDWGSKTYYTQLRLDPLAAEQAGEMLTSLLGDGAELQGLKQLILEKTEGNPFFMEEIVQALFDEEVLVREPGVSLARPLDEISIPPTVQGVLASRIDRLGADEKALLQTLSVLGKEFSLSVLKQVVDHSEEDLEGLLSHLQAAEFIYEQPAFPEPEYVFKHALTQEVAYQSVLRERRSVLHERTAEAIEEVFRDGLGDHYGELAHHYGRTGNTQKAVDYLQLAGQQATRRSANAEAIAHFARGLELLERLPNTAERIQQELTLQISLGAPLIVTKGFAAPEVGQAFTRAQELCQELGDTPQLFPVLRGLGAYYVARGELQAAHEIGEQLLRLAESAEEPALFLEAHNSIGAISYFLGDLALAREHCEQGIALYDHRQHASHAFLYGQDPGVTCRTYEAGALLQLGYPDQALKVSNDGLTLARELGHPMSMVLALSSVARLHHLRGEAQTTQELAEAMISLSSEHGMHDWLTGGTIQRGQALAEQGREEEGIVQMREGLAAAQSIGMKVSRPGLLGGLARAYGEVGQVDEGLAALAESLALVQKTGERLHEAEQYRIKGELLLKRAAPDEHEAEACFHKAKDIAQHQSAKFYELRVATSLARLWQKQGKKEEARKLLADIYGWFTEGFDTAALKEAKALLAELGLK
jgi:class 3 adenylate cyclase/predicted ATPase